jgi:hypothetical protein
MRIIQWKTFQGLEQYVWQNGALVPLRWLREAYYERVHYPVLVQMGTRRAADAEYVSLSGRR